MKNKIKFMHAVKILAPDDSFIQRAAERIPASKLPEFPGGAALEFVAALERLRPPALSPSSRSSRSKDISVIKAKDRLPLKDAIRIKSAEHWLALGEADQALRELERLPKRAWDHPWAIRIRIEALEMSEGRNQENDSTQVTIQE